MKEFRKTFLLGSVVLFTSLLVSCQQDSTIRQRAQDKDIVFEMNVGGTMTEMQRISSPLGGGARSVGSVGSMANAQGALVDGDINFANSAYFPLNGSVVNSATQGGDLSEVGSPSSNEKGFFSRENLYDFNGTTQYLNSTNSYFNPGNGVSFSVGAWVKLQNWNLTTTQMILSQSRSATDRGFNLYVSAGTAISASATNTAASVDTIVSNPSSDNFEDNSWHHMVMVYDFPTTTLKLYVDGILSDSDTLANQRSVTSPSFSVAADRIPIVNVSNAVIQDVFFTSGTSLTDAEINNIYSKRFSNHQQIAAGHILTNDSFPFDNLTGKVSYWNLNDLNDDSGSLNCTGGTTACTLTNNGGVTFTGLDIFGEARIAEFDGSTKYLSSNDAFFDVSKPFTMGGFVNRYDPNVVGTDTLIGKYDSVLRGTRISLNATHVTAQMWSSSTASDVVSMSYDFSAVNTKPNFLVLSFDGNNISLYINGVRVSSSVPVPNGYNPALDFTLGSRDSGSGDMLSGTIQEAFFSNKVLSDEDIKKLYSAKITHSKNILPINQNWQATWQSELTNPFTVPLDHGWITNMEANDLYVDFGYQDAGNKILIK